MQMKGSGTVEDFGPNFTCKCQSGFTGALCETDLNFCQPDTCQNGGTCVEGIGLTTSCRCEAGFTGQDCSNTVTLEGKMCNIKTLFILYESVSHVNAGTIATGTPSNRVHLDHIISAIIGFAVGVVVTVMLCLLLIVCCYFTCFSSKKEKRMKYDVHKGKLNPLVLKYLQLHEHQ